MRNFFLSLLVTCTLVACKEPVVGKNGIKYKSAVQYNEYIVERQNSIVKNVLDFGKLANDKIDLAEALLNRSAQQAGQMIEEIKGMPPYKGDSSLRDAAVRSFIFYKRLFEQDYMEIIRIRKKGAANITEEDIAEANSIREKIGKDEDELDKGFRKAQENYAEKNKMKLTDNKIQQEVNGLHKD